MLALEAPHRSGVALSQAPLDVDPVVIAFVRLTDGAAVEGTQAAEPRDEAGRTASLAKCGELELELGHGESVAVGRGQGNAPTDFGRPVPFAQRSEG